MHILDAVGNRIELELLPEAPVAELLAAPPAGLLGAVAEASPLVRTSRAVFEIGLARGPVSRREAQKGPPPAVFRERGTGLVRTVYREVVVRFRPGLTQATRRAALRKHGLSVRRENPYVPDQVVAYDPARRAAGAELVDVANDYAEMDEVVFATPNFVSEFRRALTRSRPLPAQWHLHNLGRVTGQKKGEDVDALEAWKHTKGKRAIVIAILDDGVDVGHRDLRSRIWRNPVAAAKDRYGRDFFLRDDDPGHYDPRPKRFRRPFDQLAGNDIHGTPCAGVAAASGNVAFGIAWRSRILPVKIFHADDLAQDERVADAIRYAALHADILSCSWSGGTSPDIELALEDVGRLGRAGRGSAVFCATGNDQHAPVAYPASDPNAIAVGASTDQGKLAWYSNVGPEVDFVAPSNGGKRGIFTTDVGRVDRGFNLGVADRGGKDGLYTSEFGGTSSATPLAAGVAALVLSMNPNLSRDDLRLLLRESADKIGSGYNRRGHSRDFGYGRVNAARAVEAAAAAAP
jgi:subtilisin family serine protease